MTSYLHKTVLNALLVIVLLSCQTEQKIEEDCPVCPKCEETSILGIDEQTTSASSKIATDTAFLRQLDDAYKTKSLLSSKRKKSLDETHSEYYSLVPFRTDLTGDSIQDFIVIYVDFHHVKGSVIDGKTGLQIPFKSENSEDSFSNIHDMFWSRPSPNENEEGLDFTAIRFAGDDHDHVMVTYQQGSPPGRTSNKETFLLIYSYDTTDQSIFLKLNQPLKGSKLIFKEPS